MTKTDIEIYRGLKEKFDPEVHVGFFITTDTGELLIGDQSLGQTISGWEIYDGVLTLRFNTGKTIKITIPEATEDTKGLLSAADKVKINALQDDLDGKVDKVTGKSLVADSEIEKLIGLPNNTDLTSSIATAKKAGTDAQATIDEHLENNTAGLTHVPAGGHGGQVLAWESDGQARWANISTLVDLEDTLSYGIEWDVTISNPICTRIGNPLLHKSLPIQSAYRGCISQGNQIMYYLNNDDWRFRDDGGISVPVSFVMCNGPASFQYQLPDPFISGTTYYWRIADWQYYDQIVPGQWVRVAGVDFMNIDLVCVYNSNTETVFRSDVVGSNNAHIDSATHVYLGTRLDGTDGLVRVHTPKFYGKSQIDGNKRRVRISTIKIDNTWSEIPEMLIDAYRSTVLDSVPESGYLSTLPVNSMISVVNTSSSCRGGGNRESYDNYLNTNNPCRSDLGKPRTGIQRPLARTWARNAGSELLSYEQYKWIFYWAYVIEYANFNCQADFTDELTAEGYRQGGLGTGVTKYLDNYWITYNDSRPITPCGYGNEFGNNTGVKNITLPSISGPDISDIPEKTFQMPRWRGFDNPFGDIWTILDGVIIQSNQDNLNYVYTTNDPQKYTDTNISELTLTSKVPRINGWIKQFDLKTTGEITPSQLGGSGTTNRCAYQYVSAVSDSLKMFIIGGSAAYSVESGLGSRGLSYSATAGLHGAMGYRTVTIINN